MGGDQFRFKQFTIVQDRCGMKVGTDGVLLAAWTNLNGAQRILDIGTGTGLIALMLAQRSQAKIDAVEIDLAACLQARENVARSPWFYRITVHHCSLQYYTPPGEKLYNLLVANPPFFTNVSKSVTPARTLARHDDQLTAIDLLKSADRLLTKQGKLTVIYPCTTVHSFKKLVRKQGFFCNQTVWIKPTPYSPPKRVLMEISRSSLSYPDTEITIEKSRHIYTPEFIDLIREFYLKY
jgi:tRNA1Val (adenine37-N6)-methyltransferase